MKKFIFGIFVWFLIQFVLMSGASAMNSLNYVKNDYKCDYENVSSSEALLTGLIIPLTQIHSLGDWCWNDKELINK